MIFTPLSIVEYESQWIKFSFTKPTVTASDWLSKESVSTDLSIELNKPCAKFTYLNYASKPPKRYNFIHFPNGS